MSVSSISSESGSDSEGSEQEHGGAPRLSVAMEVEEEENMLRFCANVLSIHVYMIYSWNSFSLPRWKIYHR